MLGPSQTSKALSHESTGSSVSPHAQSSHSFGALSAEPHAQTFQHVEAFAFPTIFRLRYFCPPPQDFVQSDQSSQSVQEHPGGLQFWPQAWISLSEPLQGFPPHFAGWAMLRSRRWTPLHVFG